MEADFGVRLSDFTPRSREDEGYRRLEDRILGYIAERHCTRINIENLCSQLELDPRTAKAAVSAMLKAGKLVRIEEQRFLEPSVIERAKRVLLAEFGMRPRLHFSEITALLGQSRHTAIALMEYFDRMGFTQRDDDYRQLVGAVATDGRGTPAGAGLDCRNQ